MIERYMRLMLAASTVLGVTLLFSTPAKAQKADLNPAPTAKDWADLAKLPDWSGIWIPNTKDQGA